MPKQTSICALAALVASAAAQSAIVVIEASHGGAGNGLTNTTITVPLNTRYGNTALQTVSTLFLTGADGADVNAVTCTPYRYSNLTGSAGFPFNSTHPSLLSTNTVQVGSLYCNASSSSTSSTSSITSTSSSSTSSSTPSVSSTLSATTTVSTSTSTSSSSQSSSRPPVTSILHLTVTPTASNGTPESPSVITSTQVVGGVAPTDMSTETPSTTTSSTPSLNSGSAAARFGIDAWLAGRAVIGLAGAGLMAAM